MILETETRCFPYISHPGTNLQMSNQLQDSSQFSIRISTSQLKISSWWLFKSQSMLRIACRVIVSRWGICLFGWLVATFAFNVGPREKYKGISHLIKILNLNNHITSSLNFTPSFLFAWQKLKFYMRAFWLELGYQPLEGRDFDSSLNAWHQACAWHTAHIQWLLNE